jgi:multiple sugar transport system permease protein
MLKRRWERSGLYGGLALFIIFSATPFYIMLISMFKRDSDLMNPNSNPFIFTQPPTLTHLKFLFTQTLYPQFLLNSTLVGVAVVVITLMISVPAAYSLARLAGTWGPGSFSPT